MALVAGLAGPAQAFAPLVVPGASAESAAVIGQLGARPGGTRVSVPLTDQVSGSVDVGTGNMLTTVNLMNLPGVNGDVPISVVHNSLLPNAAGAGTIGGWQLSIGGAGVLTAVSGGVLWTGGDGYSAKFTQVSGSTTAFTSPAGVKMDLAKSGENYVLTSRTAETKITFNADGNPVSLADRNANATTITYAGGEVSKIVSTRGPTGARTLTVERKVSSSWPDGYWSFSRTAPAGPGGESRTFSATLVPDASDDSFTFTDTEGAETHFYLDGQNRISDIDAPETGIVTIGYDASNRVVNTTQRDGIGTNSVTRFDYTNGSTTLVADPNTNQSQPVAAVPRITYTLGADDRVMGATDQMGRTQAKTYTPDFDTKSSTAGAGASAGTTTNTFGANNGQSLTNSAGPGGAKGSAEYANTAVSSKYLASSSTDDAGNKSLYTYNGAGNALTSSNALAAQAVLAVNADGTVATATAPGNTGNPTRYTYNSERQLTRVTPATGSSLREKNFTYDAWGRLASTTDGSGTTQAYTYDNVGRLTYTAFDDTTWDVANTYDDGGRLISRRDYGTGITTMAYDGLGRLVQRTNTADNKTISYGYDRASNLISTTDGRGTTEYAFDAAGTPTEILYDSHGETEVMAFATDDRGRRTDSWMSVSADRTQWSAHQKTTYDTTGRVTAVTARIGTGNTSNTVIQERVYCYQAGTTPAGGCTANAANDRSKIQWMSDKKDGSNTVYTYDKAGQLTKAVATGGSSPVTYAYAYDSRGNRTNATVNGVASPKTYNPGNQITTAGYVFDETGNLTADPAGTYGYDAKQNMITVSKNGQTYDSTYAGTSQNEILTQETPEGTYSYTYGRTDAIGKPVIEQVTKDGDTAYIESDPVSGEPLMLRTTGGTQTMYLNDGTGTPEALATNTGDQAFAYEYDPYGVPELSQTSGGQGVPINPYLFKQGFQDRTTGWVKYGARWYSPEMGRFTQHDTLDAPLDPANANRYAYSANDPINNSDPLGLMVGECAFSQGALLVSAAAIAFSAASIPVTGPIGAGAAINLSLALLGGAGAGTSTVLACSDPFYPRQALPPVPLIID